MQDLLYTYIGLGVYEDDNIINLLNNMEKENKKSDKEKISDEFITNTNELYNETFNEEDQERKFELYYEYIDQALEYIRSIGGFPENMVTGGDYTPAYNRAANIINYCILNKEHDIKLIDATEADDKVVESSQEEDEDEKVREINIGYVFDIVSTSNSETYTFNNINSYPMLYRKVKALMYDFVCNSGKQSWDYQRFYDMMEEATEICDSNLPFGNLNMTHIRKEMHLWLTEIEKNVMDFTNLKIYYKLSNEDHNRFQADIFQFVDENLDYSFILKFRHEIWDYKNKEDN
jgi:hypothetical protein